MDDSPSKLVNLPIPYPLLLFLDANSSSLLSDLLRRAVNVSTFLRPSIAELLVSNLSLL